MPLRYTNLDERTRSFMLAELEADIAAGTLYVSKNLSPTGVADYPALLREAIASGTDASLAQGLLVGGRMNTHEQPRKLKSGGYSKAPVMRSNAHEMLADGEFNRYYARGLCLRAMEDGVPEVEVYRAKAVENARSESERKIGTRIAASALLDDLRSHPGMDTALGLPPGPNSGLSVRLP